MRCQGSKQQKKHKRKLEFHFITNSIIHESRHDIIWCDAALNAAVLIMTSVTTYYLYWTHDWTVNGFNYIHRFWLGR